MSTWGFQTGIVTQKTFSFQVRAGIKVMRQALINEQLIGASKAVHAQAFQPNCGIHVLGV